MATPDSVLVPLGGLDDAAAAAGKRAAGDGHAEELDHGIGVGSRDCAAGIGDAVVDLERAAVGRFQRAGIGDGIAGVDGQRDLSVRRRWCRALVDQRLKTAIADRAAAVDGVSR